MAQRNRRRPQGGFGDGFTQAVELVLGPVLFGLLGWAIDNKLGTSPVFTVLLATFGIVAATVTLYFRYKLAVAQEDEGKPWNRRRQ